MMQPPRQIRATAPTLMSHPYSAAPAKISSNPCAYATIFDAYNAIRTSSMNPAWSFTSQAPFGPGSFPAAAARCTVEDDNPRANTASAIPDTGIPRSNAVCTVQVPVPFIPAASRITSINGPPVAASTWASTCAVISIRNESRSPLFHSPKISPISAGDNPAPRRSRS